MHHALRLSKRFVAIAAVSLLAIGTTAAVATSGLRRATRTGRGRHTMHLQRLENGVSTDRGLAIRHHLSSRAPSDHPCCRRHYTPARSRRQAPKIRSTVGRSSAYDNARMEETDP